VKARRPNASAVETAAAFRPTPASLAALVVLGGLAALLSLFLWGELLVTRAGGAAFCALADPDACERLWDGALAVGVHAWSGLPVAAWGLVWALAAAGLPLLALLRAAEDRPDVAVLSAVRVVAAAGVVAACVLFAAALQARSFCSGCFATYLLVFGYAGIALFSWQSLGLPQRGRALLLAAGSLSAGFVLLLYPGRHTPSSRDAAARHALSGTAPAAGGDAVSAFVARLTPDLRQTLSDALFLYRNGLAFPLAPPRALVGAGDAPVRITEFTDVRCGHCAELHETLIALERELPAGRFSVESRQFPLDVACNPAVQRSGDPVRCLAAKALICAEARPGSREYAGRLFAKQESLGEADVLALAEGVVPPGELSSCVKAEATAGRLRSDVDDALRYQLDGTPLVLVNGRKGVSFPPFLYAMVLTEGRADHPAFAGLPPPNPNAHLH
jgi:serine/threonine-protein kinase